MNISELKQQNFFLIDNAYSLRPLSPDMVTDKYVSWLNDYEIMKYTEQKNQTHTIRNVREFVENKQLSPTDILFGVFFNDEHIGNIKLGPINFEHGTATVSYFIGDSSFWGKGIASMMIKRVVEIASEELGLVKVTAGSYAPNIGSIRALEKNHFIQEGVLTSQVIFEGQRVDLLLFGKLLVRS